MASFDPVNFFNNLVFIAHDPRRSALARPPPMRHACPRLSYSLCAASSLALYLLFEEQVW